MKQKFLSLLAVVLFLAWGGLIVRGQSGRYGARPMAPPHNKPIIEHEGKTLLWASGRNRKDTKWFDVTGAKIDPHKFQYGIGVDRIPSVDKPMFAPADDPRFEKLGISDSTMVIGYADGDEAKAYAVNVLDRHELVNDWFRGKPVTVGW